VDDELRELGECERVDEVEEELDRGGSLLAAVTWAQVTAGGLRQAADGRFAVADR